VIGPSGTTIQKTGTGNLNINVTANGVAGGNLAINSNFTVNAELITPADTSAIALGKAKQAYHPYDTFLTYGGENYAPDGFWLIDEYDNAGITYDDSTGKFWNYTGETLLLMVDWSILWMAGATWPDGTSTGAKVTWLAINGDNVDKRYGVWNVEDTGYDYKIGALIIRSYYGPTGAPSSTLIKLQSGSYFQIWVYNGGFDSPGFGGMSYLGCVDPNAKQGAQAEWNKVVGAKVSARVKVTRLDK
jgi:hypothetical protein